MKLDERSMCLSIYEVKRAFKQLRPCLSSDMCGNIFCALLMLYKHNMLPLKVKFLILIEE